MARTAATDTKEQASVFRSLAFHIHRKRLANDVMREFIDDQLRLGRRREFRPASDALDQDGFVAALRALSWISEETSVVLQVVADAEDHRLLSSALGKMADFLEMDE